MTEHDDDCITNCDDDACRRLHGCDLCNHENHEMLRSGCPECEAELNEGVARYQPAPNSMTYPEAEEGLATRGPSRP